MTEVDVQVLIYDSASQIDNYSLDPKEDPENPGKHFGIFTWNESSFYPSVGLKDPGLQIPYDHEFVDVIDSKYFKSGIGDSDALELISHDKSLEPGSIDLTLNHGSVYLYKQNIPIPSVTSVGVSVQGLEFSSVDSTPVTLSKIGIPLKIEGEEHFISEIESPGFIPEIERKWDHVNKFTGIRVNGKELETLHAPLQFKNLDQTQYEYIIYNLPERSDQDEYGYKCQLQLPTLANGLNTLTNFLIDQVSAKVISEIMTVAGVETLDPTINKLVSNPFTRTDIFNTCINTGTPNAAGEFKINFTTGTLEVFTDNEVNFPGYVDFYTDYPAYIIFNQVSHELVGPHVTYDGLDSLVVNAGNVVNGELLTTTGTVSGDVFSYVIANGGITGIRVFLFDGLNPPTELTEYTGEDTVPEDEFKVNRYQGTISVHPNGTTDYDIYVMYNCGPTGHLESVLATTVEYKDIQIVTDLSSNNNGYIVLAQAPKSIASITYELLSTIPIDDIDSNSYIVDIDSIFNMKVCVKSPTGKPVPGVPINFYSENNDIEVLFTTGNTDRNGCVFMTFKAPGVEEMLISIPWYKFTKQTEQYPAAFTSGASTITVSDSVIPPSLAADILGTPEEFTLEVYDVLNPLGGGYPVTLQYNILSTAAGAIPGTTVVTIDGTFPFKSSGYTTATNLIGMYTKAQLFRVRYSTELNSSKQLVDSTTTVNVVELTDPRIKANFTDLVNGVFIYKTLANETLSPATISRIGNSDILANGTSLIIENDSAVTTAIGSYANAAGEVQLNIAAHTYVDGEVLIVTGTTTSYNIVGSADTASVTDNVATIQLPLNITAGTVGFTFDGIAWIDTGNGGLIPDLIDQGYFNGTINYRTGLITLTKNVDILVNAVTALDYDYSATYNGSYVIKDVVAGVSLVLENSTYNADVTTLGAVISTSEKFITLSASNTTFTDGALEIDNLPVILDSTDIGDTSLYGDQALFNSLYPFQYILLPTGKTTSGYFTAEDPFSGKIIQSDTWTITMELPTNNYGAIVLNNNLISSGSYIL